MNTRGDEFPLQMVFGYVIIAIVAIMIFGLFVFVAKIYGSTAGESTTMTDSAATAKGGVILRTYLSTRMNEPVEKFLPKDAPFVTVGSSGYTFAEALRAIAKDDTCMEALRDYGEDYPEAGEDGFGGLFSEEELPLGTCREFFLRTVLFFRAISPNDRFKLAVPEKELKIGLSAADDTQAWNSIVLSLALKYPIWISPCRPQSEQPLPGDPPLTVQLFIDGGGAC
jgi:hypothetical protein